MGLARASQLMLITQPLLRHRDSIANRPLLHFVYIYCPHSFLNFYELFHLEKNNPTRSAGRVIVQFGGNGIWWRIGVSELALLRSLAGGPLVSSAHKSLTSKQLQVSRTRAVHHARTTERQYATTIPYRHSSSSRVRRNDLTRVLRPLTYEEARARTHARMHAAMMIIVMG